MTFFDRFEFFLYSVGIYAFACIKTAYLSVLFSLWSLFVLDFATNQTASENVHKLLIHLTITPFLLAPLGVSFALQLGLPAVIIGYFTFVLLLKFRVSNRIYWTLATSSVAFSNMMLIRSDFTRELMPEFDVSPALVGLAFSGLFMGSILFGLREMHPLNNEYPQNSSSNKVS
ncbi:MAG: hypothetical protein ACU0FF_01055 [Sulfitobacter sp.]|uniref:hypothetical protein n=1 Tax=Sulfitobacter sp. TaxID=1903071 RepID=UPI00405A19E8